MAVRINQEELMIASQGVNTGHTRVNQMEMMIVIPYGLFIPIPANPNEQPGTIPAVDQYSVNSRTASGLETWYAAYPPMAFGGVPALQTNQPYVLATGNPVVTRADGALWDILEGEYVSIDKTSIGTGRTSKNLQ